MCAGYGGIELGLQLAGIDTDVVWVSEIDKHASVVLDARFGEWMMGLPSGWVCDMGLSRTQELKMLGNGVVPQQAAAAYGWLLEQIGEQE